MVAPRLKMSLAEFVAFENGSVTKHEFVNGEVYGMSGGTLEHGRLSSRFLRLLGNALEGKPCVPYGSDVRVRVPGVGIFYPDGSVVCGLPETTPEDPEGIINPKVLVEVLSDSTEAYDRGDKFAHYRRLQSFKEYVLIGQKERLIEVHRRTGPSEWEVRYFGPGEQVELASLEVRLSIDAIYATPVG